MIQILFILLFISLYGLSMSGGKKGTAFYLSGLLFHSIYIVYRGISLGWLPVTERHDILLAMGLVTAMSFIYLYKRTSVNMLLNILPLFVIVFCFFAVFEERFDTVEPYMNSRWFFMHIVLFILGYSLLTMGSVTGVLFLKEKAMQYELIQYRCILFGWLLFSLSLIAGSIWFYRVYGVYWLWTANELWITVTWLYYSFYLHSRIMKSLSGRPSSMLGLAGFAVILFSYLGVIPILGSPWRQF